MAVISGTVTYGNAIGAPAPPRFVSGVFIDGVGSPNLSDTTNNVGTYSLTGFGNGAYTITAAKSGGENGSISSFDAAKISQYVTGNTSLTSAQSTVADVSGTSGISSFDAALIARYVASLGSPTGNTGAWIFNPVNYTHVSVTNSLTEDYSALLMGEVSGNWVDSGPRPINETTGPERGIEIAAPQVIAAADNSVIIPVTIQGVADKGIISYEFDLRYDPSVIQPLADAVEVAGTVSRGLSVVANPHELGLLKVVIYGPMPIDSDGVLLNLRFTAIGASGSVSPLIWDRIMFNEGEWTVTTANGQVELSAVGTD